MRLIALLAVATVLVAVGYFVMWSSQRATGRIQTFGKYLALAFFVLAGLVFLGGLTAPMMGGGRFGMGMRHHGHHMGMMMNRPGMMGGMMMRPGMMGRPGFAAMGQRGPGGQFQGGAGAVRPVTLGVNGMAVTAPLATDLKMAGPKGVMVMGVQTDSAAQKAGLEQGDVILRFGDKTVNALPELQQAVRGTAAGATVPVTVWRNGAETTVQTKF